jgi:predicted dithiol-disulfide oxidoreductase (DUF899 family)
VRHRAPRTMRGIEHTVIPCSWPEHACVGCSFGADHVAHLAHLSARDTTLAYVSRAPASPRWNFVADREVVNLVKSA